ATPGTHPCPRRIISHRSRQDGQPKAHRWIEAKAAAEHLTLTVRDGAFLRSEGSQEKLLDIDPSMFLRRPNSH
ncbi:hypothetical protein ACIQF8_18455, partial [Pseudarthrobacter sp. NPDC092184]|uniref:hypothetical protein n=1 Tax=unclassified Pseudarthrobacter TaxID=2647000 RepID=UPI003827F920